MRKAISLLLALVICLSLAVSAMAYTPPPHDILRKGNSCISTSMDSYNNDVRIDLQKPSIVFRNYGLTYYTNSYSVLGTDDSLTISNTGVDCDTLAIVFALMETEDGSFYKWTDKESYGVKDPDTGKVLYLGKGNSVTVQGQELMKHFNVSSKEMEDYLLCAIITGFYDEEEYAHLAMIALFDMDDTAATAIKSYPFDDVDYGSYCWDAVQWALDKGVTKGVSKTSFGPQETCTRGQVATFLWRSLGSPEPQTTENPFKDISESDYYYKPILWAYENGITNGTSKTEFSPNGTCTSAQVVTFLWRANGKPAAQTDGTEYYAEAVAWATGKGLLEGVGRTFQPENNSPRADIVTYLYRNASGT